jgi:hypothetical protein
LSAARTARARAVAATTVVAAALLAGCGSSGDPGEHAGSAHGHAGQAVVPLGPQGIVPQFVVECRFSHAASDDPIVLPGESGRSHRHQFFGAEGVDASSTPDSLRGGATSCQDPSDTASYWAPALYADGVEVEPVRMNAYYRPGPGVDPTSVTAPPPGLAIVAGDHHAEGPQPLSVAGWHCGSSPRLSSTPPTCSDAAPLALRITFPDCWDGEQVDSDDHRSHMARSGDGACPRSHPVAVAQLVMDIHYPVAGPVEVTLSSGGPEGAHADFLNGWDQAALEREVRACINRGLVCGVVSNRATG